VHLCVCVHVCVRERERESATNSSSRRRRTNTRNRLSFHFYVRSFYFPTVKQGEGWEKLNWGVRDDGGRLKAGGGGVRSWEKYLHTLRLSNEEDDVCERGVICNVTYMKQMMKQMI